MAYRKLRKLKIGEQRYALKVEHPISAERKSELDKHAQANTFHFKKLKGVQGYLWYVKVSSNYGSSTIEKEENRLLEKIYNKVLNKKKDIDDIPIWD